MVERDECPVMDNLEIEEIDTVDSLPLLDAEEHQRELAEAV